ncbi:MAG: NYN domain-containing protein [Cyanobacteria bacterium J06581_3]
MESSNLSELKANKQGKTLKSAERQSAERQSAKKQSAERQSAKKQSDGKQSARKNAKAMSTAPTYQVSQLTVESSAPDDLASVGTSTRQSAQANESAFGVNDVQVDSQVKLVEADEGKKAKKPSDKAPVKKVKLAAKSASKGTSKREPSVSLSVASEPTSTTDSPNPSLNVSKDYQPVNQSSDRIAIFIDGSNLFYAASHLNIEVDYRRLLSSLVRGRRLLRAYFYTGVDPQNEKQRGFLLWLNRHGHRVVSKELTHLPDGSRKANMHVEMAVDMMRISEYCPNITLLGGDGNLAYALQVLSQRGTFIEVVSLQSMTSDSLIDLADSYTDLADLRDAIKR